VPLWYAPAYRLPIATLGAQSGQETRRADFVAWYLLEDGLAAEADLRTPVRAGLDELGRVHETAYLESLAEPETLARIFAVSSGEIVVDEVMRSLRLIVGGTIAAARHALAHGSVGFNLAGGFHHAGPAVGGGFCALDDVAVAIAAVRADGCKETIVVLDLDAHPPDGLSACLVADPGVRIGSISGSDWGPLPAAVDETFLPDADDTAYHAALDALLSRMPRPALCFVLAGGDVLAGDRLGKLRLTLEGVRERDRRVHAWLAGAPAVWLPAGGYSEDTWKVVVGSYLAATDRPRHALRDRDPAMSRYASIYRGLDPKALTGKDEWSLDDIESDLYGRLPTQLRLLDYYTAEGVEHALERYGFLAHVRRLGYSDLRVELFPPDEVGQRMSVLGDADGKTHLVFDLIVSRDELEGEPTLLVHWLSLRNPRAAFTFDRKPLPGQEVPGLGLARDVGPMLGRMAERLGLRAVAFRPAYFHTAFPFRHEYRFADAARQARFVGLLHDLADRPIAEITRAFAEGRVLLNGARYAWEAEIMIHHPGEGPIPLDPPPGLHFSVRADM
jgi:acetoin utilization deacetylase AcuC-like enzyme